nr:hypothetical protein [Streptacidiphilus rugosus]
MIISALAGTSRSTVSAGTSSRPSPNSAPRKWLSSAPSGSGVPPTEGSPGSTPTPTPTASAIGIGSPRSVHFERITPRCCGGGIRHARAALPSITIRLTDQLVHVPSGVLAMFIP